MGAKAKTETKVAQWEAKLVELRRIGDEERIAMAEHPLGKAHEKVEEKEEAIQALDCIVRRMERIVAAEVDEVKEEVVDEVVEVQVEAEEMVEETVKEEVEAKVVVETAVGGGGDWLRFFGGRGMRGPSRTCHGTRPSWLTPSPKNMDQHLLVPPESPVWTPRFFDAAGASKACGGGEVGMGGRGGGGPRGQAHAAGGGPRVVGVASGVARAKMGGDAPPPPPGKGGEDV